MSAPFAGAYQDPQEAPAPHGLPGRLPAGERVLWQGAPDWRAMARHVFRIRWLAAYVVAVLGWSLAGGVGAGGVGQDAMPLLQLAGACALPPVLVLAYSLLVARCTAYTITDARVVVRLGTAFPMTVNLPFSRIETAAIKLNKDGSGDISLSLAGGNRLSFVVLWPHARPWRLSRPEPSLRAVPDAARVGQILGRALAASANMPAPALVEQDASHPLPVTVPA